MRISVEVNNRNHEISITDEYQIKNSLGSRKGIILVIQIEGGIDVTVCVVDDMKGAYIDVSDENGKCLLSSNIDKCVFKCSFIGALSHWFNDNHIGEHEKITDSINDSLKELIDDYINVQNEIPDNVTIH